jgi:hypothetical protein
MEKWMDFETLKNQWMKSDEFAEEYLEDDIVREQLYAKVTD